MTEPTPDRQQPEQRYAPPQARNVPIPPHQEPSLPNLAPSASGSYSTPPSSGSVAFSSQPPAGVQPPQPQGSYPPAPPVGYPPTPGYAVPAPGHAGYAMLPPNGRTFWAMQFLFFIPYVGFIVAAIVALVMRNRARQSPHEIERENARWAANWALSAALYFVVYILLFIGVSAVIAISTYSDSSIGSTYSDTSPPTPFVFLLPLISAFMFGVFVYWLVTVIRGLVLSDRVVHRPALAIPFIRG